MGQGSTTATVRGNIQDSSGGVLPGATVTLTNTGTKAVQTAVSDDRGQYLFAGLFPGTYDLKVELSGFKTYEQKGISLSPNDTRGIDVRLDVGQQSETVTVTAQQEVIQTETGAREGVLTAKQIDNLSVIGRSALELLRILPGVVADFNIGESVSFGGGGNNTQNYTVNGIRSSSNTVAARRLEPHRHRQQQRRHRLPEQRHGSGSEGPELQLRRGIRHRRHERERCHQGGHLEVPRRGLRLLARFDTFAANDRSNSSPASPSRRASYKYPGGNVGGPIFFGDSYTKNKRQAVLLLRPTKWQRQQVDSGARFSRTYTPAMQQRRLQRAARQPRHRT